MSGTASVPGWYIEFQAAVLRQLPRPGEIDQNTVEGWSCNQKGLKKVLADGLLPPKFVAPPIPVVKFEKFADLGIIEVPPNYIHKYRLEMFRTRYQDGEVKSFYYYNNNITDAHFPNPSRILKPGDRLRVEAHSQTVGGTTTSEERMEYLHSLPGTIFTGAQGVSLVWEQKRDELPKGYWYSSFDEKNRLWKDADGNHRVSGVDAYSDGGFGFSLGRFGDGWVGDRAMLRFCDESA